MFAEKIGESVSTTGTGTFSLTQTAYAAFRTWRSGFTSGDLVWYMATNDVGTIWEIGYGVFTTGSPDTLTRTLVVSSSGALINWVTVPYRVYSVPTATALKHMLAPLVNGVANVPGWLPASAMWLDYALGLATAWVKNRYIGGTRTIAASHSEEGRHYLGLAGGAGSIFSASERKNFVDNGAADRTLTLPDLGKVIAFNTTAAVRVFTMLAASTTGMGHGAYVDIFPYGSSANGVTFTPGGADTTATATAPPGRITRFQWDGTRSTWVSDAPISSLFKGTISGWAYANAAGDVTNDLDIPAGAGVDSTGVDVISGAALTKQSDANWVVGNNAGGLDTGAVGNSDYFIWAIKRPDTGVVDYLYSLSNSAPTMPANYTLKRLIGWFRRSGAAIVLFKAYETAGGGLVTEYQTPPLDVNSAALTTARLLSTISVPVGFSVEAKLNVSADTANFIRVCNPDQPDVAPSVSASPLNNYGYWAAVSGYGTQMKIRTNTSAQIAARANAAASDFQVVTEGFEWSRR